MADKRKSSDKSRKGDTTTKQTSSPSTGTTKEKRTGDQGSMPGAGGGARTTEDMVREQGADSRNEPE